MCFRQKTPKMGTPAALPEPEKTAEPEETGAARKREDESLFGADGKPQLRTDRAVTSGGVGSGAGLRMT